MTEHLKQLIAGLNSFSKAGTFQVESEESNVNNFPDYKQGDIGIFYDYNTDELTEDQEEELNTWLYDVAWPSLYHFMYTHNHTEVDDQDGSGGGLYYGTTLFRKK